MKTLQELEAIVERVSRLRHELHQFPEVAHQEKDTAKRILAFLAETQADQIIDKIGGNGIIATYKGEKAGKSILFRAELDALPIAEVNQFDYRSKTENKSHKCGHDGHMAILCGLASLLQDRNSFSGTIHLLFQPAEETGEGAQKMLEDEKMKNIRADYAFALHNLPGFEKGEVVVKSGIFAAASKGMIVKLKGKPSHASHPKDGINPTFAATQILQLFHEMPNMHSALEEVVQITPVGIQIGQKAFGTSAGEGELYATIRTYDNALMESISAGLKQKIKRIGELNKLTTTVDWTEEFQAVENSKEGVEWVKTAAKKLELSITEAKNPFPWSEDFGQFGKRFPLCLFGLGSGKDHPQLHNEDYDFPDEIIPHGIQLFNEIIQHIQKSKE